MATPSGRGPTGPDDAGPAAAGRVAAVHRQTRRSLVLTVAFVAAAVVLALVDGPEGRWAALHLFLLGALLTAISTATVYLSVTWSAAPAPPDSLIEAQRWILATAALGVVASRRLDAPAWTTVVTALVVVLALAVLAAALLGVRRHARVDRFLPAIDGYLVALAAGALGSLAGALLAGGVLDDLAGGRIGVGELHARVRGAHMTLNLFGMVGLVVASTLPYMSATQSRSKMSRRATPGAVWSVIVTLAAATAVSVVGSLSGDDRLAAAGIAVYALALLAMVRLLPVPGRRQLEWAGPRLLQLASGVLWWVGCTAALAWIRAWGGVEEWRVVAALVIGGYGQIVLASLAYLGPVVRGGGHVRLGQGFATTRSWVALAAGNVAAVAALTDRVPVLALALAVLAADLVVRGAALVSGARRAVPH